MRVRLGAFLLLKLSFAVRVSQHRYNYSGTRSALRQTEQGSTTVMATTIIAAIQMTSTHNKLSNLQTTIRLVECAAHRGASLIALPECSSFIGGGNQAEIIGGNHPKDAYTASETLEGPYAQALCQLASRLNVWLSVGGFPEIAKNDVQNYEKNGCGGDSQPLTTKVYNTHFMISPAGIITEKYRKIHLFDSPYAGLKESISTVAGDSIAVADCGFARVGLTTCYDLRFPELYGALCRPLRSKHIEMKDAEDISGYGLGADVVLVPSAFTVATGIAHWEVLLRARAIENQCYVVAAAQTGTNTSCLSIWLILTSRKTLLISFQHAKYSLLF